MNIHHTPVLFDECLKILITNANGVYFDGTLGFGGHTQGILNKLNDEGRLIATDFDTDAFNFSKKRFENDKRANLYNFNFSLVDVIAKIESIDFYDGILADLGVSSFQLDNAESGFSYRSDTKLDLRMDKSKSTTAADIVNTYSEEELANIIYNYGEERNSRKISRKIIDKRKSEIIKSTGQLTEIISEIVPPNYRIKTLSRVFQALRIFVNDELENLKSFLNYSLDVMKQGSRIVIISYHSLEDRIVKEFFRDQTVEYLSPKLDPAGLIKKEAKLKILTKKPMLPSLDEIQNNYRARSAKLRAAVRI
ncbi:MAG: 16S rRNA (cytosine(1402)-N(4))-methyltransferase RsmH [Ignavibacterium sp.]|nr:16S rRNA (cytosine(1402)-N(4))-methyltransferase RsmH [Ignavibacterium sp.]